MTKPNTVPEKVIQQHGVALLRTVGAHVLVAGTRRPRGDFQGTCMTPGLPDVLAFVPRAEDRTRKVLLFWEVKSERGKARPEQLTFQEDCRVADVHHVMGGVNELVGWLLRMGNVTEHQIPHYRVHMAPRQATGQEG